MKLFVSVSRREPEVDGKLYSPQEIAQLSEFTVARSETQYYIQGKQGRIVIDNKYGLGETPNGRNVLYLGCVGIIQTDKLLKILPDMNYREQDSYQMLDLIKRGYGIASPILELDIDPFVDGTKGCATFTGHEGRSRTWALSKLGVKEVPVQIIFNGYRARHVKNREEFAKWIDDGVKLQGSSTVAKNVFSDLLFG